MFFGGRNASASAEYEGKLSQLLGVNSFDAFYASSVGGSWYGYSATYADVSSQFVSNRYDSDKITSNVTQRTVEALEYKFTPQCRNATMFIGASQGGVIATQMAIQRACMGIHTTLILLSSSPTPWQMHQVKFLIDAKLLTMVTTLSAGMSVTLEGQLHTKVSMISSV